ncbi:DUF2000 domain-containing protein [Saccharothrix texasensis]|uniref:Uncharacterized protein DUF2000 n=1 Tax=Saccharothrix texasensis TaxID=103734 RepID=A0A3N1H7R3_9PSEU|nr:DUF2000 domain-containing protein [Saccharothrix texasensis]ROP38575.1 uncharacterized protein DUF2000 [Saccharothrix texasensis]
MLPTRLALILRDDLPPNLAANAAVVLGLTLGARLPDLLGEDVEDADGTLHLGLNTHPVPVLTTSAEHLKELHRAEGVLKIGFTEVARRSRAYPEYVAALALAEDPGFVAVALYGPRAEVTRLTRKLPLMA